ncbi:hypothetical protein GF340_01935 [Candidatus Peregrinibacteria bacterium]|nr:hypothetical protein [Candidatus Peregrinibacteria bacterium]
MPAKKKQSTDSIYLDQLEYHRRDSKAWINFFISNFKVVALIIVGIIAWGFYSLMQLPLESDPEVEIPFAIVSVGLPGASPSDVEELVIKEVEPEIANVSGIKEIRSTATDSVGIMAVEFRAEEELAPAIRRLRDAVETARTNLPEDASDPVVNEVSANDSPVWTVVVTGPYDNFTMRHYADLVKEALEKEPGANEVSIAGGDLKQFNVSYDPNKLESVNLSAGFVNNVIRSGNFTLPIGTLNISNYNYSLRAENEFSNTNELRQLPIAYRNSQIIRLKDVATVLEKAEERNVFTTFSFEGSKPETAVTLNVTKKVGFSIIALIDNGKARIENLKGTVLPDDVKVETTLDVSDFIRDDISRLSRDGLTTMLLVAFMVLLFVGLKEAFMAGILAIPLSFGIAFGIMNLVGISINFLSLFSLILSLGLLVDDAIVVVQASKQYLATGKFTPEQALLLVFKDYKYLLLVTTLTTISAFFPLVLATGIIGRFIFSIPVTVTATLAASTFVAVIINMPLAVALERYLPRRALFKWVLVILAIITLAMIPFGALNSLGGAIVFAILLGLIIGSLIWYRMSLRQKLIENEEVMIDEMANPEKIKERIRKRYHLDDSDKTWSKKLTTGVIKLAKILPFYERLIRGLMRKKRRTFIFLLFTLILFAGAVALPVTGLLKSDFLSPQDYEYLYVNIEGPPGMVVEQTGKVADKVEKILIEEPTIKSFTRIVGSEGIDLQSFGGGSGTNNSNKAQFAINLYPLEERPASPNGEVEKSFEIGPRLRQLVSQVEGANVELVELQGGPPSGADFEVRLLGDNLQELEKWADELKSILTDIPGTVNESTSLTVSPGEFTFKLKQDKLTMNGLSSGEVASTLRLALYGLEVTELIKDDENIIVWAQFDEEKIPTINAIENLTLVNNMGGKYRLGDVADVELGSSLSVINRLDQKRVVAVTAAVEAPALPNEVLMEFQEKAGQLDLPSDIEIKYGGQNETNEESIISILYAMILSMFLIISILVIQYNSFGKAVLVLATIPLAITGVFYGLWITGFTLSFPALIGILALFGIVVKNALILVDKINLNQKIGIEFVESIVDAAKSRLEAIYLTTFSTVIGMIPLALGGSTWSDVAVSLIFGLAVSTFLTLFVIPILYHLLFRREASKEAKLRELRAVYESRD